MQASGLLLGLLGLLALSAVVTSGVHKEICHLPQDPGECLAYISRYYYNSKTHQCEYFIYGGCKGNENNFETLKECRHTCEGICYLPVDTGICYASIPRYFFSQNSKKCEKFIYGGCGGNANNFRTLKQCRYTCEVGPGEAPGDVDRRWTSA
ncbi:hypothetical protein JRQ81_014455 [Phrynocephalus forsythii]|uniref:BPTI/Kunitz inhibitor domain-containing protein n=1 Tax=Phrynocephalus forsythii TaxID=171643 RepID=A0A9Q0XYN4_9SAUR|nr:hypothetical protein JRQ81_014455 [Phrynocephalus forsythii]